MGTLSVDIQIGDASRERWVMLEALIDTGASITSAPASVLRELDVQPLSRQSFKFARGEVRVMDIGQAWVRFEGQEFATHVLFNDEDTPPLLGAQALEAAFVAVDQVAQKLFPVDGLML